MGFVGSSPPRIDGVEKVTGSAKYIDDISFPKMLHGATVRSTIPHGKIRSIKYDPSFDWSQIIRVDASDIPGENVIALIEKDQPCLADGIVRHVAEPIVLLAAENKKTLIEALRSVSVEY